MTDRKGQVTGYAYDMLDRLSQVTFDDSSTIAYTYDAGDRVTQITDSANGTITRQFDDLNRLTQEVSTEGTINYTYDLDGRRTSMAVLGQPGVTYGYDDAHRLTSVTQGSATALISYDAADRRATLTYLNGVVATYAYDAANRLVDISFTSGQSTIGELTYTYDAAGNRTAMGGSWARAGLPPTLTNASYDSANRNVSWGGVSLTYDLNGNLTSDGTNTYTWNARNQLVALSGTTSASFQYDGVHRRRSKTVGASTTRFLYDGANLVQELSGATPTANLVPGLTVDEVFTRNDAGGTRALLTDALGSVTALADSAGGVQTQYTFEPFGGTTSSGSSSSNPLQFTGRENDVSGLYFYRYRYYNSRLQRFMSEDPLDFQGGSADLYAYARNSPANVTDPFGLWIKNYDPEKSIPVKPEDGPWGNLPPCMEYPGSVDGWLQPGQTAGPPWYKVPGKSWMADNNIEIGPGQKWVCVSGPCNYPKVPYLNAGPQVLQQAPDNTWNPPKDLPDLPNLRPIPGCKPNSKSDK
jgi:RHS repeat-associated protein